MPHVSWSRSIAGWWQYTNRPEIFLSADVSSRPIRTASWRLGFFLDPISRRIKGGRMKPALMLLALVLFLSLGAKEKPAASDTHELITLDPIKVHGTAISSYAIDVRIMVSPTTKKIVTILITRVMEDSDAAEMGLLAGDEIVKVNGIPVGDIEAKVNRESQLGRLFLNRRPGEPLRLEVMTRRARQLTLHAQNVPGL